MMPSLPKLWKSWHHTQEANMSKKTPRGGWAGNRPRVRKGLQAGHTLDRFKRNCKNLRSTLTYRGACQVRPCKFLSDEIVSCPPS